MPTILHYQRQLVSPPQPGNCPGITIRNFAGLSDIRPWLEIRRRAFAGLLVSMADWSEADFAREFLDQPWFRPERMWFAEHVTPQGESLPMGTITLARRPRAGQERAAIHWLAVAPGWRRSGVGRLLVETLEQAAWHDGFRRVELETHITWRAAIRLYESLGYERQG